ncbi:MAG: PilZ domain-containing protein [Pirellulaceae bacterium]|nr:PilZ domain-containing protein [Planctomycetales bacterium]
MREVRYQVNHSASMDVSVEPTTTEHAEIDAVLLDISLGGAKLRVAQPLPEGERLTLRIHPIGVDEVIDVEAAVCWSRIAATGDWWLGCSFTPRLPEYILSRLAEGQVLDRRHNERMPVDLRTAASWELSRDAFQAEIRDISRDGFCLQTTRPGPIGGRVMLRLRQDDGTMDLVTGKCRWQIESSDGFLMGCEFTQPNEYGRIRKFQESQSKPDEHASRKGFFSRLIGRS